MHVHVLSYPVAMEVQFWNVITHAASMRMSVQAHLGHDLSKTDDVTHV